MPTIIELKKIKALVKEIDVISAMKEGFIQYSRGHSVVPPVGELIFKDPPGDVHIKYGYILKQKYYVIKIASGFYENPNLGLPSGQGLMLLFKQKTGELEAILLDEGYLTNIRTVAAGALAVKHFGGSQMETVGVIGTGTIAKMQIQFLKENNLCQKFYLWGRSKEKAEQLKSELGSEFDITISSSCAELANKSSIIITTTASEQPLLKTEDISSGTLVVAIGSDTAHKQELAGGILAKASLVIADSIPQSKTRGEVYQAISSGTITEEKVIELGRALEDPRLIDVKDDQVIVVDLTGVAVQDIMIATAVFLNSQKK